MSDVIRITVFVTNIKDVDAVDEVYKTFFPMYVPTRTTVAVAALPMDALVQVETLVSNGVGTIPNAPQAGDLIKLTNNTENAPECSLSTQAVVKINIALKNITDIDAVDKAYTTFFPGGVPARRTVGVSTLPGDAVVQIDAVAGNKEGTPPK